MLILSKTEWDSKVVLHIVNQENSKGKISQSQNIERKRESKLLTKTDESV